jgi:hypothetical protein
MVLFLTFQSIATAVTYFLGRDIYAAVIPQNFKGIVVDFPRHNSVGLVVVLASLSSNFFLLAIVSATPLLPVHHLLEFEIILGSFLSQSDAAYAVHYLA